MIKRDEGKREREGKLVDRRAQDRLVSEEARGTESIGRFEGA